MKVDLAKDQQKVRSYILQRIQDYAAHANSGPGEQGDPIRLVTMGYYLDQTGYVALVFDTRADADNDGEWTLHIEDESNMLHFPDWCALLEAWDAGEPAELALADGTSLGLTSDTHTHEFILETIGEMLRDTMIQLRDEGALRPLPLDERAFLIVEEFDGRWSWPQTYETRKQVKLNLDAPPDDDEDAVAEESEDDRKEALIERIGELPPDEQIEFWTTELKRRAQGEPSELDRVFLEDDDLLWGNECALDELERIGTRSVVPLLELVLGLAHLPEWGGDSPQQDFGETPMQGVAIGAVWKVRDLGLATEGVETLLHRIIRTACAANAGRTLWGIVPYHAARCLHTLFEGYPEPSWDENTNRLETPERFQSRPQAA